MVAGDIPNAVHPVNAVERQFLCAVSCHTIPTDRVGKYIHITM